MDDQEYYDQKLSQRSNGCLGTVVGLCFVMVLILSFVLGRYIGGVVSDSIFHNNKNESTK